MPRQSAARPLTMPAICPRHLALLLVASAGAAQAQQLTRAQLSAPAAMVSVCGGLSSGSYSGTAGDAIGFVAGSANCASGQVHTAGDSVSRSAGHTEALITAANAQATATLGQLQLASAFRANNQVGFAGGFATAGWVDTLTIQPLDPAQVGQTATLQFQVRTTGNLVGVPSGNSGTGLRLNPFVNNSFLPFDGNNPGNQGIRFGGQGQGGFPYSATVDRVDSFTATITLGTAFSLGVFAMASSGVAGAGPDWWSEASNQFGSVAWNGITGVQVNGAPVAWSLSAVSGVDWAAAHAAPVPEPATWALLSAGAALLLLRRLKPAGAAG